MRVYVDSSALLKRVVTEAESDALEQALDAHARADDAIVSSSLAWVEVSRVLRGRLDGVKVDEVNAAIEDALAGVVEHPITGDVVSLSRRIGPNLLRSLDAIHLATAVLVDADCMVVYDARLADAARHNGLRVATPV